MFKYANTGIKLHETVSITLVQISHSPNFKKSVSGMPWPVPLLSRVTTWGFPPGTRSIFEHLWFFIDDRNTHFFPRYYFYFPDLNDRNNFTIYFPLFCRKYNFSLIRNTFFSTCWHFFRIFDWRSNGCITRKKKNLLWSHPLIHFMWSPCTHLCVPLMTEVEDNADDLNMKHSNQGSTCSNYTRTIQNHY